VCLDGGISTGGFTDCLLQRGARRVYGIDVGYGQTAWSLRTDPRVVLRERTNLRHLSPADLYGPDDPWPDLAVADVSFISLTRVLPALKALLQPRAEAVLLVKPQFEVGRERVGKGGVVRDPGAHVDAITTVAAAAAAAAAETAASPTPAPHAVLIRPAAIRCVRLIRTAARRSGMSSAPMRPRPSAQPAPVAAVVADAAQAATAAWQIQVRLAAPTRPAVRPCAPQTRTAARLSGIRSVPMAQRPFVRRAAVEAATSLRVHKSSKRPAVTTAMAVATVAARTSH